MTEILLQLAYLGAMGFCLCTSGWLMLKAQKTAATNMFIACQMLIMIWCLPQLFLAFAAGVTMKYVLYGISYIAISLIGPCWLIFSWLYCGRKVPKRAAGVMLGISAFDYAMFLTNGIHHLFYGYFSLRQVVYGPVFYFHMAYTYGCVILGIWAVLRSFRNNQVAAVHAAVITGAAAVPLIFNMVYLSGAVKSGFDLTPPVFAISSFLMLVAVFRYDFLDINVVASRQIFSSMEEGVIICNRRGRVTYCNETACGYAQVKNGDAWEDVWQRLLEQGRNREIESGREEKPDQEGQVLELPDGRTVRIKQYPLHDRHGKGNGGVLLLTDVSQYYERLRQSRELAVSRQRLAIEQERNRIAQEVHDTTGHTLTMIQSLIKLVQVGCDEAKRQGRPADTETEEYLRQARELASSGIRELRQSIHHMRQGDEGQLVTQGVCQLAGSVREIQVETRFQGEDGPRYSHLSPVVYQCVREAITNCLKYACASHMDVIVKFTEPAVNVYIFDDGQGCECIRENNGLSGIRKRVLEAGGQVRFLSAPGEGFQIFFELPVEGGERRSHDPGGNCG